MSKSTVHFAILFFVMLFPAVICYAQSPMQTVVYLKDGSIYRGKMVTNTDTVIKIKTAGSDVMAIRKTRVDSIKKEKLPRGYYLPYIIKSKGYFNTTTLSIRSGDSYDGLIFCGETVNGYRFCRLLAVGAGAGIELDQLLTFYPVYFSVYSDILPGKTTPFVHVDGGYNLISSSQQPNGFDQDNEINTFTGGWYGSAGVGLKFHSRSLVNIIVGLTYSVEHWSMETHYYYYTVPNPTVYNLIQTNLALQVGFGF